MGRLPVSATPAGVVDVGFDLALGMSKEVELSASHEVETEHVLVPRSPVKGGQVCKVYPQWGTVPKKYQGELCQTSLSALGLDLRTPSWLI